MSHFTNMKTCFQNLFYLEQALNKLEIAHKKVEAKDSWQPNKDNLIISQSNGYDIQFCWNGQEYELVIDMSFWEQTYPVENFIDKIIVADSLIVKQEMEQQVRV